MGKVASTLKTAVVACATAAGAVALGIVSAPVALAGVAVAAAAAPIARGVNYLRRSKDPTYADNIAQYNSKFARQTQLIIDLWQRIYGRPSGNTLDELNNTLIYQPVINIQAKLNQFSMNSYMTVLNRSEKMQTMFQKLYSENTTKDTDNFELYDGKIIKYNDLEHTEEILKTTSFVGLWINGTQSSNNPIRNSIYDKFMELNTEKINKMINRLNTFKDEMSDDIIWSDKWTVEQFSQKLDEYKDISIQNLLNAITILIIAHKQKLESEIEYYRGKNRSWSQTFKSWTQGMLDTLYRSGFSAEETADAYEKHINIVLSGILEGAGYGPKSLKIDYRNGGNKLNSIVENIKILKLHINSNNNKITIEKSGKKHEFTINPTSITILPKLANEINDKLQAKIKELDDKINITCNYVSSRGQFQFFSNEDFKIVGKQHTTIFDWIGFDPIPDYTAVRRSGPNHEPINAIVSQNIFPINPDKLNKFIKDKKLYQEGHILNSIKDDYKFFLSDMKRVTYIERLKVQTDSENK